MSLSGGRPPMLVSEGGDMDIESQTQPISRPWTEVLKYPPQSEEYYTFESSLQEEDMNAPEGPLKMMYVASPHISPRDLTSLMAS